MDNRKEEETEIKEYLICLYHLFVLATIYTLPVNVLFANTIVFIGSLVALPMLMVSVCISEAKSFFHKRALVEALVSP